MDCLYENIAKSLQCDLFFDEDKKKVRPNDLTLKRRLPTLPRENRSTIGAGELNFSVRNGKRWNLTAITT